MDRLPSPQAHAAPDDMTPAERWAVFEAGWEGARQGLAPLARAVETVRRNPQSGWAALLFGRSLYQIAAARRQGIEP